MSAAEFPVNQPSDMSTLWSRALEQLATELPEQQFNAWIRPLPPAEVSEQDGTPLVSRARAQPFHSGLDPYPVQRPPGSHPG